MADPLLHASLQETLWDPARLTERFRLLLAILPLSDPMQPISFINGQWGAPQIDKIVVLTVNGATVSMVNYSFAGNTWWCAYSNLDNIIALDECDHISPVLLPPSHFSAQ